MKNIFLFLFIDLAYCISTIRFATRQAETETDIMNDDFEFSVFEIEVENSTDPSTNCTGEFWQPSSHKGRPVCKTFSIFVKMLFSGL